MRHPPRDLGAVVFDLDDTLLDGRTILFIAREFGFDNELDTIFQSRRSTAMQADEATGRIAAFLKGRTRSEIEAIVTKVPPARGGPAVIDLLRKRSVRTFIATDGYDLTARAWAGLLGMDGWISLGLTFDGERASGAYTNPAPPPCDTECLAFSMCKGNALMQLSRRFDFMPEVSAFVGDGPQDVCGFRHAGFGVAIGDRPGVREKGDAWLPKGDLTGLPGVLGIS